MSWMNGMERSLPSPLRMTENLLTKGYPVLYHEYVDCLNPALAPGSGTYELKNHSIIFQYSDGRKIKIAFTEAGFDKNNASLHQQLLLVLIMMF